MKNIAFYVASLSLASAVACKTQAGELCGQSTLANEEIEIVGSIQRFCKDVKGVAIRDDVICFVSKIDPSSEAYKTAFDAVKTGSQKYFYINSGGGGEASAVALAIYLKRKGKTLIINEGCFSACANYVFTAAPRRILLGNAQVGWHGTSETYPGDRQTAAYSIAIRAQIIFLKLFTPDERTKIRRLIAEIPADYPYRGSEMEHHVWTYPDRRLCEEYGLKNIIRLPM